MAAWGIIYAFVPLQKLIKKCQRCLQTTGIHTTKENNATRKAFNRISASGNARGSDEYGI